MPLLAAAAFVVASTCWIAAGRAQDDDDASAKKATAAAGDGKSAKTDSGARQLDLGGLPWVQGGAKMLPPIELTDPRQQLDIFGIGESQLAAFFDRTPLGQDDEESLAQILFRLPQIGLPDIARWQVEQPDWSAVATDPDSHRAQFFAIEGTVVHVAKRQLIPELSRLYDFADYFRVDIRIDDGNTAVICTRSIPASWPIGEAMSEPGGASGLFLKLGDLEAAAQEFVCAARRVAWRPNQNSPGDTPRGHRALGELGMDVGLLDDVRERNRMRIGGPDRECFYQMLAAAARADAQQLDLVEPESNEIAAWLEKPETQHGLLTNMQGVAQRITRIVVTDKDIRERFGITEYYQIDFFVSLGNQTVKFTRKAGDDDGLTFVNEYPTTVCVPSLPPELKAINDQLKEGELGTELLHERVRIRGFFFKLWPHSSEYADRLSDDSRQMSPMFIAAEPELLPGPSFTRDPWLGLATAAIFLFALGLAWLGIWRSGKSADDFHRDVVDRRRDGEVDLAELDVDAEGPDFSQLPK
ncbi:MAG: hypothetical protein QGG36_19680 [Pirellulaceae bacterium]|jgi:hypothetical protein|nr:hypothetical protein [Pirellulaceae bacterium]MDP7018034.1 hypothetical protein [Pirellulaceae bacterium]